MTSLILGRTAQLNNMRTEKRMPVTLFAAEYKYGTK